MSDHRIILASGSKARQEMLKNAGVKFQISPANIDEEKVLESLKEKNFSTGKISLSLAKEKALEVSKKNPDNYIIGSDQVLSMNEKIYSKAKDIKEAQDRLLEFQGNEHLLTSSVCLVKDGEELWNKTGVAALKMKSMDSQAIDKYIKIAGETLTNCVGCYAVEDVGIRLFEDIRGDYFTILGMPLLPLLNALDKEGLMS